MKTTMKTIRLFHYLSHARWIFVIWAALLVVQAFVNPRLYALPNTGLAVFLAGLFLGFWGFSDIEKLSKRDKKTLANPESVKISAIVLLAGAAWAFVMGVYFMNIRKLRPAIEANLAAEMRTIGYHCLAFGFGFLCYLKMVLDKYKYYQSLTEHAQDGDSKG